VVSLPAGLIGTLRSKKKGDPVQDLRALAKTWDRRFFFAHDPVVDNYDSFTYNLVQRLGEIDPGINLRVVRNDQVTVEEIEAAGPLT